jgi:predicted metal-dependent phosphoesterase TrpH
VLVDFHTHTTASDGALTPQQLLERAADAGVECLSITDHDTVRGVRAAASSPTGVTLVNGVELSCVWGRANIHVVGLDIDCSHSGIVSLLASLDSARQERARAIGERLEREGMPGAYEGALDIAGDSQIGRPHFAEWLVRQGHVSDAGEAFNRWLGRGKTGDVKTYWPALSSVVEAVVAAGGIAVLAHPLKYGMTRMKLRALVQDFVTAGGAAIEVVSGRQTADETAQLRRLADEFALAMSLGSDFHREWQYGPDLGVSSDLVPAGRGVWEQFS